MAVSTSTFTAPVQGPIEPSKPYTGASDDPSHALLSLPNTKPNLPEAKGEQHTSGSALLQGLCAWRVTQHAIHSSMHAGDQGKTDYPTNTTHCTVKLAHKKSAQP